jgi:hypothetical protein
MAKAYDRIEWNFLRKTLQTMGFPSIIIDSIMSFVCSVSFSVLVNGKPSVFFKPKRGLRQGDHLSSYLFICAEVFSGHISRSQDKGFIHGLQIAQNAPPISHLFLLMIVWSFVGLLGPKLMNLQTLLIFMKELLVKKLT